MIGLLQYGIGYGLGLAAGWFVWGRPLKRLSRAVDQTFDAIRHIIRP